MYELKIQRTHNFASSVHKYHKSSSKPIWQFYRLLQLYELKCQKTHNFGGSLHKYQKSWF